MTIERGRERGLRAIPRSVWVLGFVSMFMDISSEIVHALLPLFLTVSLGASVAIVGLIDGIAESTASISKVFSGYISDRIGRRKPLVLLGYGLAALSKPLFPLAASAAMVFGARFADRIGKGIRGAPRDALIADATPTELRGRAFGLRQGLDTVGAFVGPLLAIGLMYGFAGNFRHVFAFAIIPAVIAVLLVVFAVREPRDPAAGDTVRVPIKPADLARLPRAFWSVVAVGFVFSLARFSEAFLILRATGEGLPFALAPLVLVAMNLVYSAGAYPAGVLADAWPARRTLYGGLALLVAADLLLGFVPGLIGAFAGIVLWGGHMALTQGLLAKLVADTAPSELRGSAFGLFYLTTGLGLLAASVIAGLLWDRFGATTTFACGAGFAAATMLLLALRGERRPESHPSN